MDGKREKKGCTRSLILNNPKAPQDCEFPVFFVESRDVDVVATHFIISFRIVDLTQSRERSRSLAFVGRIMKQSIPLICGNCVFRRIISVSLSLFSWLHPN